MRNKDDVACMMEWVAGYSLKWTVAGVGEDAELFEFSLPSRGLNLLFSYGSLDGDWSTLFSVLRLWSISIPDACVLCDEEEESVSHLFLKLNFPKRFW